MSCETGLSPKEFWDSTLPEILSVIHGYQKRLYHHYSMNRALRYHILSMMSKNQLPEVFDWEPLEGDPTKEERERDKKIQAMQADIDYQTFKSFYQSQGVEVM
jgi:hypothetical protein